MYTFFLIALGHGSTTADHSQLKGLKMYLADSHIVTFPQGAFLKLLSVGYLKSSQGEYGR